MKKTQVSKARKRLRGSNKIEKVMGEFKNKILKSGSGAVVTSRPQAQAIALSEAGLSKPKKKKKKG